MPLLLLFGLDTKKAVGTSAFIVTFISLSGFLSHVSLGGQNIDMNIMILQVLLHLQERRQVQD